MARLEIVDREPAIVRETGDERGVVGMHESTITRVATGCQFQNLHGLIAFATKGKKLGFQSM